MAFSDDIITATTELKVMSTDGTTFADFLPEFNKAYVTGKLGVGNINPVNLLDVEGGAAVGASYSGTSTAPSNGLIVEGNVGIGTASPAARLQIANGALMPSIGNSATAGIQFPPPTGGGAGDSAWVRYYARSGESMTLEIGVANDPDDHIALMPSGNVGIGTATPANKLDVGGDVALSGKHAFRGSDSWLRLNQAGAFISGVHTPGVFAPGALNVGGAGGWGNPGGGNVWVTGSVAVGTTAPQRSLHVHSDAWSPGAEIHASGATAGFSFTDREAGRQWDSGGAGQRWVLYSASQTARLWSSGVGDRLSVSKDGTFRVIGPYAIVNGAGGEQAYIGGDGAGNDVQVGSFNGGVTGIGFWNAATGTRMNLFGKSFVVMSDARWKTGIEPLGGALDKVLRMRGVSFDWLAGPVEGASAAGTSTAATAAALATSAAPATPAAPAAAPGGNGYAAMTATMKAATVKAPPAKTAAASATKQVGTVAQEIRDVVPEAVIQDSRGMYGVDYGALVAVLIEAIKELSGRLDRLDKQVVVKR